MTRSIRFVSFGLAWAAFGLCSMAWAQPAPGAKPPGRQFRHLAPRRRPFWPCCMSVAHDADRARGVESERGSTDQGQGGHRQGAGGHARVVCRRSATSARRIAKRRWRRRERRCKPKRKRRRRQSRAFFFPSSWNVSRGSRCRWPAFRRSRTRKSSRTSSFRTIRWPRSRRPRGFEEEDRRAAERRGRSEDAGPEDATASRGLREAGHGGAHSRPEGFAREDEGREVRIQAGRSRRSPPANPPAETKGQP